jgi:hypothetical protein
MAIRDSFSPSQLLGQTIGPGYRLVALLDASGHSFTFRAWDHGTDRYVVVKVCPAHASAAALAAFAADSPLAESVAAGLLPVIEYGVHGLSRYVVLPYLAGGTLRQRRPKENDQPRRAHPALLYAWLPAIATALDVLHARGLAHGALAPDTILFDASQQCWLACCRIAAAMRAADPEAVEPATTATDVSADRLCFRCPQQLLGLPPSAAGDQFSLAAIVYDYLAAQQPFAGSTPQALAIAQAAHDIPPIGLLSPQLPASLCKALHRGLAHNPRERHASCREFADRLLEHVPVVDIPRKLRLLCPSCGTLAFIEPVAAGRTGNCLSCKTQIEVDSELRWLALAADRRADLPVSGAEVPRERARRRWLPVAIASLAATAALAMLSLRSPDPLPLPPPPPDAPGADGMALDLPAPQVAADRNAEQQQAAAAVPKPLPPMADDPLPAPPPPAPPPDPVPPFIPAEPPAVADNPAPPPPRNVPDVEMPQAQRGPAVADMQLQRVRNDLDKLHETRKTLVNSVAEQNAIKAREEARIKNLALENAAVIRQQADVETRLGALRVQFNFEKNVIKARQISQDAAVLENDYDRLTKRLAEIVEERDGAKSAIESVESELIEIEAEGDSLRQLWISELNALERDAFVSVRIDALSAELLESPAFNECHIYRALLYVLDGDGDAAQRDLDLVDPALIDGPGRLQMIYAIDYAYAHIMLGNGSAARSALAVADKTHPNEPVVQHVKALCEILHDDFIEADALLKAALRKQSKPRVRAVLYADAAWLYAAAPSSWVRNRKLANDYARESLALSKDRAWKAWRAQAVLHADEGRWRDARESLAKAQATAPLLLAAEIQAQADAIEAKQPYRFARTKNR